MSSTLQHSSVKSMTILPFLSKLNSRYDVILASGSPRRKELLSLMGIVNFRVLVSSFAEDFDKKSFQLSSEYCAATAQKKLEFVVSDYATQRTDLNKPVIIIAADTVVDVDNMTLEKPTDKDDSFRMIKMLSG